MGRETLSIWGLREEEGDTGREAGLVRSQCQGHWSRGLLPARPPAICSVAGQALRSLARGAELALSTGRPAITVTLIEQTACHAYRMPSTGRGRGHCRAGKTDAVCSCGTCMGRRGTHDKRRLNAYASKMPASGKGSEGRRGSGCPLTPRKSAQQKGQCGCDYGCGL